MRKSKSQSLEGLDFVKQVLPPDLHQFAHLIPLAVSHHVSWLEPDRKEYALTVALAAFDKAVKKRRGDSTDAEFGQYAKQCIRGAILNEFGNDIGERQFGLETPQRRTEYIPYDEEAGELQQKLSNDFYEHSDYDEYDEQENDVVDDDTLYVPSLKEANFGLLPGDSLYIPGDDEEDEYTVMAHRVVGVEEVGVAMELLPVRERDLLQRIGQGVSVTQIAEETKISKARVSQLLKQARERLARFEDRLELGERFSTLREESCRASSISTKKQSKGEQPP